jgi:putative transposase
VLKSFARKTRDKAAALNFIKKMMTRHGKPEAIVTDGLRSYGAALEEFVGADDHECGRWLNNRVENFHQPLRRHCRSGWWADSQRSPQRRLLMRTSGTVTPFTGDVLVRSTSA